MGVGGEVVWGEEREREEEEEEGGGGGGREEWEKKIKLGSQVTSVTVISRRGSEGSINKPKFKGGVDDTLQKI